MSFFKQTINTVPLQGQTVLVRVDYNVPFNKDGTIGDDFRIRASLPTIKKLLHDNCKVVLISHCGRPDGHEDKAFSLEPIAQRLAELLDEQVRFCNQVIGDKVKMAVRRAPKSSVIMLENLRFHAEEEANDEAFARKIAQDTGARYFVQDGFGVVHRAHASTSAITHFLPSVSGLLIEREYTAITQAMKTPQRPLIAVLGGAKVSDKIGVIQALVGVADGIIIGGSMANTFLAYKGVAMGSSKFEPDQNEILDRIYEAAAEKVGADNVDNFLILPSDVAIGQLPPTGEERQIVSIDSIGDAMALDIGDETIEKMVGRIAEAKTVIWNGPLGMTEYPMYTHGSARLALALATHPDITSIIGGGDTADFVLGWDARNGESFTHISTGGGASMELMAGEKLPGIESLLDAR
jgi:phosphoglycerate kinase